MDGDGAYELPTKDGWMGVGHVSFLPKMDGVGHMSFLLKMDGWGVTYELPLIAEKWLTVDGC